MGTSRCQRVQNHKLVFWYLYFLFSKMQKNSGPSCNWIRKTLEQGTGIEPAFTAWEAVVLPIYEPCIKLYRYYSRAKTKKQHNFVTLKQRKNQNPLHPKMVERIYFSLQRYLPLPDYTEHSSSVFRNRQRRGASISYHPAAVWPVFREYRG